MTGLRSLLPVIAIIGLAAASDAQEITGVVRTSAGIPVSGAVLLLVDSAGGTLMRTLSGTTGQYRLVRSASARTVRVVRIGFRPRAVPLPEGPRLDVTLESLPTMLQPVRVVDQPHCSQRRDRPAAFSLWEQAQAGLLSSVVARQASRALAERLVFYRILNETRPRVLTQVVRRDTGSGGRPFAAARTAAQFIERGFFDAETEVFYAPDADVLLDDWFARGYCFRLADGDRARPHEVGLLFEPAARKRGRIDVVGTLWVDTIARELRDLEFLYRGLPVAADVMKLGGHVRFETMPAGYPAITRWSLRVAAARSAGLTPSGQAEAVRVSGGELEVHETGGELAVARWDDTSWTAQLGTLRGRLMRDTVPSPGTKLHLVGTPYAAITNAAGEFTITGLLPGRYTFGIPDSTLNAIGMELTLGDSFTSNRDDVSVGDVPLPTIAAYVEMRCPDTRATALRMVVGRVYGPDGNTVGGADLRWRRGKAGGSRTDAVFPAGRVVKPADTLEVQYDTFRRDRSGATTMFYMAHDGAMGAGGSFVLCQVPPQRLYRIEASGDGMTGMTTFVTPGPSPSIHSVRIDLLP